MKLPSLLCFVFMSVKAKEGMKELDESNTSNSSLTAHVTHLISWQQLINLTETEKFAKETNQTVSIKLQEDVTTSSRRNAGIKYQLCKDSTDKFTPDVPPWNRSHLMVSWDRLFTNCTGSIDTVRFYIPGSRYEGTPAKGIIYGFTLMLVVVTL